MQVLKGGIKFFFCSDGAGKNLGNVHLNPVALADYEVAIKIGETVEPKEEKKKYSPPGKVS